MGVTAREVVDARKSPIAAADVNAVLDGVKQVSVARGKSVHQASATEVAGDPDLMKKLIGPSGNLRAPAIVVGARLLVGFNSEMYDNFFNG